MKTLAIDLETYSSIDLRNSGVYAYTQSEDFRVLLFAYAFDDEEVKVVDLAQNEEIPKEIVEDITSSEIIKTAFNANFERTCLAKYFNREMPAEQWRCSAAHSLELGLPGNLAGVARCLNLEVQKMSESKALIRYFCIPCKATKANEGRTRNLPMHDLKKWGTFKQYCKMDVEVERSIRKKIRNYPMTDKELNLWFLDQRINDYGVRIDKRLVENAIRCDEDYQKKRLDEATNLTGLDNPNSPKQLKDWLMERDIKVDSLSKDKVEELLEEISNPEITRVLELRQDMSKTSVKKYQAMYRAACDDSRVRGLMKFYGAATGRFSSEIVQIQNLRRNLLSDLYVARELLKGGQYEALEFLFDSVPDVLSQLIRTAFIPSKDSRFIVSHFSAIEARVIAWLAGEKWRMDVFESHGKIYEASASHMFGVPIEKVTKDSEFRRKGKISELACIAEGELVLTDRGLVPIEKISLNHMVWDGEHFVNHDSVIYKGIKEAITYDGLTASEDHLVWVEGKQKPVRFGEAAASRAHLLQSGDGRKAIRVGENNKPRKTMGQELELLQSVDPMRKLWANSMDSSKQSAKRNIKGMSKMFTTKTGTSWELRAGEYSICHKGKESREPQDYCIKRLEPVRMALCKNGCIKEIISRNEQRRSHSRCKKSSRGKKKELENNRCKVRLYDILNAGPNNRFTVSNKLVHNCGYGGSVGALKSMGAIEMGVKESDLMGLIKSWRKTNPNIVRLWYNIQRAAIKAVKEKIIVNMQYGLKFNYRNGILFIKLPSGRNLAYVRPKVELDERFNRDKLTFEGITPGTRKWGRVDTYGGKLTENIVQAIARDCLSEAMIRLDKAGYKIAFHVHDEVVLDVLNNFGTLEEVNKILGESLSWARGLLLSAEGFESEYYKKD